MFKKILLIGFSKEQFEKQYWDRIERISEKVIIIPKDDPEINKQLKDTDCLLVKLGAKVGKDLIDNAPKLRYIGMLGTGFGGIDTKYASEKNITVCNIQDYATEGVAEFTFGVILEYLRELERAKIQLRDGKYDAPETVDESSYFGVSEIKGKNFGVIGLGYIGTRTAEIAKCFGANVHYWDIVRKPDFENKGIKYLPVDDLLITSDIITINIAKNEQTLNFLNDKRLLMIKKNAIVVNPSPMELIDFDTMMKRVASKEVTFILDHSDEMAKDQIKMMKPFLELGSNLIVYPPIAYTTKEATARKKEIFVANLENYLKGIPTNIVS